MREYAKAVAEIINREYEGYEAEILDVVKVNDETNTGVLLRKRGEDTNISSVHYISAFFDYGVSEKKCAEDIIRNVPDRSEVKLIEKTDNEELTWEDVKDYVTMRLVNVDYNKKYLADKIYKDLGNGFAIMYDVTRDDCKMAITHGAAKMLKCDEVMLACAAQMSKAGRPILCSLAEKLLVDEPTNYLESGDAADSQMLVLTTKDGVYGASTIYRSGVGERIEELVGNYYMLPASLHEWIIVPESADIPVENLCSIVEGANHTVVDRKDLLAYGVYKWTSTGLEKVA